jgi:large subunit ribosomal protein L17
MRHLCKGRKLGRTASHRSALLANLATSLFKNDSKRIKTTVAKAKEARMLVDKIITKAKNASVTEGSISAVVHAKREIYKYIRDRKIISSIFTEVVPKVKDRPGGYTRVVKIGQRLGDGAEMAILELVDFNIAQDKESATTTKEKKGLFGIRRKKQTEDIQEAEVVNEPEEKAKSEKKETVVAETSMTDDKEQKKE